MYFYSLKDSDGRKKYTKISAILGLDIDNPKLGWVNETTVTFNSHESVVNKYLEAVEQNKDKLFDEGVSSDDISFWLIYEYENECNLEFEPKMR